MSDTANLPTRVDIAIDPGNTIEQYGFAILNPDGTPYDLTGCHARWTVRTALGGAILLSGATPIDFTDATGVTIDTAHSTIYVPATAFTSALSAALPSPTVPGAEHALAVLFADGTEHTTHIGTFVVRPKRALSP